MKSSFSCLPALVIALLTAGLSACHRSASQPTLPTPLAQDPLIQVYTNHEPASRYTEPYRNITRAGDNLEQVIIDLILSAQTSIDVAVQEFRLPNLAKALAEKLRQGVRVRVVLENTYSRPYSSLPPSEVASLPARERSRYNEARKLIDLNDDGVLTPAEISQRDALVMLDQAGIPRIDDTADGSAGSNLMHHKFVVVDNRQVIVTSANFTTSDVHGDFSQPDSRGNANNMLKIEDPDLAQAFTEEFNILWGDGPGGRRNSRFGVKKPYRPARSFMVGDTLVELQFSPTSKSIDWSRSTNGLIGKTLNSATASTDLALFVFSEQRLVDILANRHRQGTQVRALVDPSFAYRPYSEVLDMFGVTLADENCKIEPTNRPWTNPITTAGVPGLPPGDLLHNKFGVVDQQTVITGSHNWTDAANIGNDETLLVVHSPIVAAHYQREFERLYARSVLGLPPFIKKKIERQQQQCRRLPAQLGSSRVSAHPQSGAASLRRHGKKTLDSQR